MIRKLAIAGTALVVLVVGANVVAERAAESALSDAAADALGIDGAVEVDIRGFPILFDVLRGRLDGITATARGHRIGDLTLRSVAVGLTGLRAKGSIFGDGSLAIVAERADLIAETDARAINAFLRRRGEDARVRLLDGEMEVVAERTVLGVERTFIATGPLRIEADALVFRPREVRWGGPSFPGAEAFARRATTVREDLPALPGEIRIDAVTIEPDRLRLTGSSEGRTFTIRD
jgi:hypothetical protein